MVASNVSDSLAISTTCASVKQAAWRKKRGTATSRVPPRVATVICCLSAITRWVTAKFTLRTMNVSGVTVPLTTLSPSPQLALIMISARLPVIGLAKEAAQ